MIFLVRLRAGLVIGDEKLEVAAEFEKSTKEAWPFNFPERLYLVGLTFPTQM